MNDIDDIALEVSSLEKTVNKNAASLSREIYAMANQLNTLREDQKKILEMLHLISNPTTENREKVNAIMDAYERYEFVRKLSTTGE